MEIKVNEKANNYMDFYCISEERSIYIKNKLVEVYADFAKLNEPDQTSEQFLNSFLKSAMPSKPEIELLKVKFLRNCESINELIWAANFYDAVQSKFSAANRGILMEVISGLQ